MCVHIFIAGIPLSRASHIGQQVQVQALPSSASTNLYIILFIFIKSQPEIPY